MSNSDFVRVMTAVVRVGHLAPPDCQNCATCLDHAVLAAGYGVQGTQDYWLVQNRLEHIE